MTALNIISIYMTYEAVLVDGKERKSRSFEMPLYPGSGSMWQCLMTLDVRGLCWVMLGPPG